MKSSQILMLAAAGLVTQCLNTSTAQADELYHVVVNTKVVETNNTGGLSYQHYGNRQIIAECAADAGMTNVMGLRLVYDRTTDALEVVKGTNDTVVCTPLMFHGGVSLSKTNGDSTVTERLAFVFLDSSKEANGTLRATETLRTHMAGTNIITQFRLHGQLQFASPAAGTNAAKIYSGDINAGPAAGDRGHGEGDEDQGDQGQGDPGQGDEAGTLVAPGTPAAAQ